MGIFEGKTSTERNKMIAAAVLGVVALVALYLAFGSTFFGSRSTTATVTTSPTPRKTTSTTNQPTAALPTADEQAFVYETTPVIYNPNALPAPDPGRNIFAFYEPPPPCPECPTPVKPIVTPKPPTPTPTPVFYAQYINPTSVYAGQKAFRLEVSGDRFTPESRIYFNQNEMPTRFVSPQRVIADIPANLIAQEGPRQVIVQTPDGRAYSEQLMLNVQAPPKPTFQYIGMIGRKRYNNDTAYFIEPSRTSSASATVTPFGARLNDVVAGRFRLIDIAPAEVVFEDVNLGFKHRVPISKATATTAGSGSGQPPIRGFPDGSMIIDPSTMRGIPGFPGIPANVQPVQPRPQRTPAQKKEDVDDDDPGQ